jgi:hypothetical protein
MKSIRESNLLRILWFVIAVHLLNCSVDTPDPGPFNVAEDLSINDQESVVEVILEQFLNIEDAVSEFDEPGDENEAFFASKSSLSFFPPPIFRDYSVFNLECRFCLVYSCFEIIESKEQYSREIHLPPPESLL